MTDINESVPLSGVQPPDVLIAWVHEPRSEIREIARRFGHDVDEDRQRVRDKAESIRDHGIIPELNDLERLLWRTCVAGMYAVRGGDPADYTEEASAELALYRADCALDLAKQFFPKDHPLRPRLVAVLLELRELGYAHRSYMGLDEADALDDRMRAELDDDPP
jgi:hypothetical protein